MGRAARSIPPVGRRQAQCFLQHEASRRGCPRDGGLAGSGGSNRERRGAGDLDRRGQCPETAGDGILAVGQWPARVRLADGAADGIDAARACAATAGNLVPVNGVGLSLGR